MRYDHPTVIARRFDNAGVMAAGTTAQLHQLIPPLSRLKRVHARVHTAGTATAYVVDVYHGTTSISTIALGTGAAGITGTTGLLDTAIAALDQIYFQAAGDATGRAIVNYEWEILPDAVVS